MHKVKENSGWRRKKRGYKKAILDKAFGVYRFNGVIEEERHLILEKFRVKLGKRGRKKAQKAILDKAFGV